MDSKIIQNNEKRQGFNKERKKIYSFKLYRNKGIDYKTSFFTCVQINVFT